MSTPIDRRTILNAAGVAGVVSVAGLSACSSGSSSATVAPGSAAGATAGANSAAVSVTTADVPVGGGKVVGKVVVTQPVAGTFKAFSATCTHEGCAVSSVADNKIKCACHNSYFDASTGAPVSGPAKTALPAKTATVSGDTISVA